MKDSVGISQKGTTKYSQCPSQSLKFVFHLFTAQIRIRLYAPLVMFREDFGPVNLAEQVRNHIYGVLVRDFVESPVVYTRTQTYIFFLYKLELCTSWRSGVTNKPILEIFQDVILHGLGLGLRQRVNCTFWWSGTRTEINWVIIMPMQRQSSKKLVRVVLADAKAEGFSYRNKKNNRRHSFTHCVEEETFFLLSSLAN